MDLSQRVLQTNGKLLTDLKLVFELLAVKGKMFKRDSEVYYYASLSSGNAYSDRELTTNFEF